MFLASQIKTTDNLLFTYKYSIFGQTFIKKLVFFGKKDAELSLKRC
ncbi:Hypothetical protein Ccan_02950 [Capnocytophaga canimorsus Cc5]|uniref:Uncharacterized protein n=1 Tax=Capnocytophaga canimorsus (strain 5) TaxID=860228 RepID=F9YR59_CAPCC|nr:Hypothetical protein Ccan_02950 [Capnocytophaga canimorsus Cc5]